MTRRLVWLGILLAAAGCTTGGLGPIDRVFLVTFDTTRADHIGAYGAPAGRTPTLDALAADGALFEQVVSPAPTTMPSHSTMMTGLYPPDHGVRYNLFFKLPDSNVTLAESLSAAGFATGAFPATHIVSKRFGLDQGFEHWVEPPRRPERDPDSEHPVSRMRPADEGVDDLLDWLGSLESDRSFAWLHFYDPHWPYDPPFPFSDTFRDAPYVGEIAFADAQLGRLIEALRAEGSWERTLLIVAGDHGEGRYDHNEPYHSILVYESTQRVPMIIHGPGIDRRRIAEPVTLADITPTVLDALGLPNELEMRGTSLVPALKGKALPRRELYFESLAGAIAYGWLELSGIRVGDWKLIDSNDPELFDLDEDPGELANRADDRGELVGTLREGLAELSKKIGEVDAEDAAYTPQDEAELAQLRDIGYVAGTNTRLSGAVVPHPRDLIELQEEILSAQSAGARGDWRAVERVSDYVLERDPTNKWALTSLASARMRLGRADEAIAPARRMVELAPDEEDANALLASVLRESGDTAGARQVLDEAVKRAPESERLRYLSIVAAFDAGDGEVCGRRIEQALVDFEESSRIRLMQARCEARAGRTEAALAALEQAWELGFRRLDVLEGAEEFSRVRRSERYRALEAELAAEREPAEPAE